jgi:hypothetical protein
MSAMLSPTIIGLGPRPPFASSSADILHPRRAGWLWGFGCAAPAWLLYNEQNTKWGNPRRSSVREHERAQTDQRNFLFVDKFLPNIFLDGF